jgi:hypothetical protein
MNDPSRSEDVSWFALGIVVLLLLIVLSQGSPDSLLWALETVAAPLSE